LQSKGNGSNYYPYGESKSSTAGDDREGFATYTRDEKSGLDYADQRWYASGVGRFLTPDPYMAERGGGHSLLRPSSFGRYAYVEGNPASYFDPLGLMIAKPQEGPPPNQPSNGDRIVLGDGMAEPVADNTEGSPSGSRVASAGRIIGTSNVKEILQGVLKGCSGMNSSLIRNLERTLERSRIVDARTGIGADYRLAELTNDSKWGATKLGEYLHESFSGTNARAATLITTGRRTTNVIALMDPFFDPTTTDQIQRIVGIHELLHSYTHIQGHGALARHLGITLTENDDDQDASKAINNWIKDKCKL
jgi:RHS repeat-associated protein